MHLIKKSNKQLNWPMHSHLLLDSNRFLQKLFRNNYNQTKLINLEKN